MPEFLRILSRDSTASSSVVYMTSTDKNRYVCEVPNVQKQVISIS